MVKVNELPVGHRTAAFDRSVKKITDSVQAQRDRVVETTRGFASDKEEPAVREKPARVVRQKSQGEPKAHLKNTAQ